MNSNLGFASIPAVNQYLQWAKELNIEISPIIKEVGISENQLEDNSQHISGEQFQHLIQQLIKVSKDSLFGLHTAKFVQPGSYSVLGYISMNCETLGHAISKIPRFEKLVGDMGTTTIESSTKQSKISWDCQFPNQEVKRHMIDNCLASWLTFARYLVNQACKPNVVNLTRVLPSTDQQVEYQRVFSCPVKYNQLENAIIFDSAILQLPLNKGDQQLLSTLELHAESIVTKLTNNESISVQVAQLIQTQLESGDFHQQDIAKLLAIGSKTLQRRLKAENTSFQLVLDTTRLTLAKQLLADAKLTLNVISAKLGFAEPRSFYRWFNKLTSQTPGNYRVHLSNS